MSLGGELRTGERGDLNFCVGDVFSYVIRNSKIRGKIKRSKDFRYSASNQIS